jgi:hypothetical protein
MGPHQRKDLGNGAWFSGLSLVEGAALFDFVGGEAVRRRAQKPLAGFLIHPSSRGGTVSTSSHHGRKTTGGCVNAR